ncbi:MAG: hypothetical protein IJ907_01900 [Prevotella sp.]|nr:hypothetical protein [Prevotella sp.]MBR2096630.1 hypothetical protein [Prevotella sp.]
MRLIDADALNTYDVSPAYGMTVIGLTEEDIELAPTIDAIPIDWIRQWHQRRVSGRKNYKAATTMVIRELLDAWDAERNGNSDE